MKNKKIFSISIIAILLIAAAIIILHKPSTQKAIIHTSEGDITIELYANKAPITVKNFETYAKEGFYNETIFHRVIKGFMIQGGGFTTEGIQKQTHSPIKLESDNGLLNEKYTIAMARTNIPDSATSQFFINTANNKFLDYTKNNPGYAVFGKVISGQEIVDKIESTQTITKNNMENWPTENIIIYSVELI